MRKEYWFSIILFFILCALSLTLYISEITLLSYSLLWTLIISFLNYSIIKRNRISLYRTIYFVIIAAAFLLEMHLFNEKEESILQYCHVGMSGNLLHVVYNQFLSIINSNWGRYGALSIGVLWLLVILINGQGFCSWVCFFGGIDDGLSQILKKPVIKLPSTSKFREFQIASFVFFAFISFIYVQPIFCIWVCPLKITNSILNPNSPAMLAQTVFYITIGIITLLALPLLTKRRFFCSTICPFGAIPPLLDKIAPYKITVDIKKCASCYKCMDSCPSFAIEKTGGAIKINKYCTLCGRCIEACGRNLITTTLFHIKPTNLIPFISMLIGGSISLFFVPIVMRNILEGFL